MTISGDSRGTLTRRTKVLFIDLGTDFGGVENYLINLSRLLGKECELHAVCVNYELAKRLRAEQVCVRNPPRLSSLPKPLKFLYLSLILPWIIIREDIEVVQLNGLLESIFLLPVRLMGREAVYTRHGPFEVIAKELFCAPLRFLPRFIARTLVNFATQVICVSETIGDEVKALRPRLPVVVIPNWIEQEDQADRSELPPVQAHPVQVLCASRLEHYKGLHLVIDAVTDLRNTEVVIAGEGPYRATLENLAAEKPVTFVGFQKDMRPLYEAADIFIMPSLGPEGLPVSSLEAMGRGIPCILSDLPVHVEITRNGKGGMLFSVGSVLELTRAMTAMVKDPALRREYGERAYKIVENSYTAKQVQGKYLEVFLKR